MNKLFVILLLFSDGGLTLNYNSILFFLWFLLGNHNLNL